MFVKKRVVNHLLETHLYSLYPNWYLRQAQLASLPQLQSQTQEELDALLPSVLDKAFKGEL